jgi:DNA-directed RNA polymerase subunit beta
MRPHLVSQIAVKDDNVQKSIEAQNANFEQAIKSLDGRFSDKVDKLQRGDELMPGVMKMVKVFVAVKRKLQPGDKMAGRHGNKGVISRIMPSEDMPYLEDGTPVDIVLNPLGVPSRMNVGQILETHLGWAARGLGVQIGNAAEAARATGDVKDLHQVLKDIYPGDQYSDKIGSMDNSQIIEQSELLSRGVPMATPVFDGAREADVIDLLGHAGLSNTGQELLIDGRTGEVFDRPVTVGYIYMLNYITLWMKKSMRVQLDHTALLPSSRWAVRHSSVVSALVKWKCGHSKLMVLPTPCRKCLPSSLMMYQVEQKFMKPLCAVMMISKQEFQNPLTC